MHLRRLCVYCGSNRGIRAIYAKSAREFGVLMAKEHIELVFGGGGIGLMGELATAVVESNGNAIGIIPRFLADLPGVTHPNLTETHIVETMHERKQMMADLADGLVALPGGYGTFEEILEALTWTQLSLHHKPCAILNIDHFFDPLIAMFDHAIREGFMRSEHRSFLIVEDTPQKLLNAIKAYHPTSLPCKLDHLLVEANDTPTPLPPLPSL